MSEYSRRINIRIEVDRWDWGTGRLTETIDLTQSVNQFTFQKSIKSPTGTSTISLMPQWADQHILDLLKPMDVVRISEFGILKYQGYIQQISYSGAIGQDGKPSRTGTISAAQIGSLLTSASVGWSYGQAFGADLKSAASVYFTNMADAVSDGLSFKEILTTLMDSLSVFLETVGADKFVTFLNHYLDLTSALNSDRNLRVPRAFDTYTGTEEQLQLWSLAEEISEKPFNELWIDNGPRKVHADGKPVELKDKSYLIFRETPFDGTIDGISETAFTNLPTTRIDKDHLIRFDLSKSMAEAYSIYNVKGPAFQYDDPIRILLGEFVKDTERLSKYLFKPLTTQLYYTRLESQTDTATEMPKGEYVTYAKNKAQTLYNWFHRNDEYLSGALSYMVPSNNDDDPKIGQKLSVYGIEGYFYVEAVSHEWNYQGPLKGTVTVTRGYNKDAPIVLRDRIFNRNRIS